MTRRLSCRASRRWIPRFLRGATRGSVRKSGNHLRVTTQLIRADKGEHLWSETYDREQEDVFKIQDDIAGSVVDKLRVALRGSEAPRAAAAAINPQVYNL